MEHREKNNLGLTRIVVLVLICCLAMCLLVSCNNKEVQSIEVVESCIADYYYTFDGFTVSALRLRVTYADGETTSEVAVTNAMLSTEDKNALKTPGEKAITIFYQGKTVVAEFYLTAEDEEVVAVTFNDVNNVAIASKTTLKGSSVTPPDAPEIEGQYFKAWVEKDGKTEWSLSDFDAVEESITLTASYTTNLTKYNVTFYDYNNKVIATESIVAGEYITSAPSYVKPDEIASFDWSVTFPYRVERDTKITMQNIKANYCRVQYGWKLETAPNTINYLNDYSESVKYGSAVTKYDDAKKAAASKSGGEILTEPTENRTKVIKNTDFIFVIAAKRVTVTVYNNEGMTSIKTDEKSYRIGDSFTFPLGTGEQVSGKTFKGWRLYNPSTKKYSDINKLFSSGSSWTVNGDYSSKIYVVPYYQAESAVVTFHYDFTDILKDGGSTFTYDKGVSDEYFPGDAEKGYITYASVLSHFNKIKNTNGGSEIKDGSDSYSITAYERLANYEIISVYVGTEEITANKSYKITTATVTVTVNLKDVADGTAGLLYKKGLVLDAEPVVSLAPDDEITAWYYDGDEIAFFPYFVADTDAIDLSLLSYTTKRTGATKVTAPSYYAVVKEIGEPVPAGNYYFYDSNEYKLVESFKPVFQSDVSYYTFDGKAYKAATVTVGNVIADEKTYFVWDKEHGYRYAEDAYVPVFTEGKTYYVQYNAAGYTKAAAGTIGSAIPLSEKYYIYSGSAFVPTAENATFAENTTYYKLSYALDKQYYYGYEITGTDPVTFIDGNIYLPDKHNDLPVVSVADIAFGATATEPTDYIHTISKMPSNLLFVGSGAFRGNVISDVADFGKVVYIGSQAFAYAELIGKVSFPSLQVIGGTDAFAYANRLARSPSLDLTFGQLKTVPANTFYNVKGAFTLTFANDCVARLEDRAFYFSEKLSQVNGLGRVLYVGNNAFSGTALTSVSLPAAAHIGAQAFSSMNELTVLSIGTDGRMQDTLFDFNVIEDSHNVERLVIGKQVSSTAKNTPYGAGEVWDEKLTVVTNSIVSYEGADSYALQSVALPKSLRDVSGLEKFVYLSEVRISSVSDTFYADDGVLYAITVKNDKFVSGKTYYVYNERTEGYDVATVEVGAVIPEGQYYLKQGEEYPLVEETVAREYTYELVFYPSDKIGVYQAHLPTRADALVINTSAFGSAVVAGLDLCEIPSDVTFTVKKTTTDYTVYAAMTSSLDKQNVQNLYDLCDVFIDNAAFTVDTIAEKDWEETKVFGIDEYKYYYSDADKLLFELYEDNTAKTYRATVVTGYTYATEITVPKTVYAKGRTYEVTAIGEKAFYRLAFLEKLTVNASLIYMPYDGGEYVCPACGGKGRINDEVCYACNNEGADKKNVFAANAFGDATGGCDNLKEIVIAGWHAEALLFDDDARKATVAMDSFKYTAWYNATSIIAAGGNPFGYNHEAGVTVITASALTASGFKDNIPAGFFKDTDITSISFPSQISVIGANAFAGCASLVEVSFGAVINIRESAFENCVSLEKVSVPMLTAMSQKAFAGCEGLTSFSAPMLTAIPVEAFKGDGALKEVSLPKAASFATNARGESSAFQNCSALTTVSLPAFTATTIPGYTFYGSGLKAVDFVNGFGTVTTVGQNAFDQCGNLTYVLLGSNVTGIENNAFVNCNANLCVEIPYAQGGLYDATELDGNTYKSTVAGNNAKVAQLAFPLSTSFYVDDSASGNFDMSFLRDYSRRITTRPSVSFAFFDDGSADYTGLELGIAEINKKIYFTEQDFIAPSFNGFEFVGWYDGKTASAQEIELPAVMTTSRTIYARYYSLAKGTLANEDVKYVFVTDRKPDVSLDNESIPEIEAIRLEHDEKSKVTPAALAAMAARFGYADVNAFMEIAGQEWGETATYEYYVDNKAVSVLSDYILTDVKPSSVIRLDVVIKAYYYQYDSTKLGENDCITVCETKRTITFDNPGVFGYAIVNYQSTDAINIYLPDTYDDGENGPAPIIAVYSGAFRNDHLVLSELKLPKDVKVILKGYIDQSENLQADATFNHNIQAINIPDAVEYIESGLLSGLSNIEELRIGDGSKLLYTDVATYKGTTWYKNAVLAAEKGAGFVMAGHTAIEYVGNTDSVFVADLDSNNTVYSTASTYGINALDEDGNVVAEQKVTVYVYKANGTIEKRVYEGNNGGVDANGCYTIELTAAGGATVTVTLDCDQDGYKQGSVKIVISDASDDMESYRFVTSKETSVIIPSGTVKLADGIMKDNKDIVSLTLNSSLVYIGSDAFNGASSLTTVGYDLDQGKLTYVGENAFVNTQWYLGETVIVGGIFLKYNNRGHGTTVTVPSKVTRIAKGAFAKATQLEQILFEGNKLTTIEDKAFAGSGITAISLPASVTSIGRGIFKNCPDLSEVDMSKVNVALLPQDTFYGCASLATVRLSNSFVEFGKNAFYKATGLSSITADGVAVVDVEDSALDDTAWFTPDTDKFDRFLILGEVLVKYVMGTETIAKAQQTDEDGNKLEIAIDVPAGVVTVLQNAFSKATADSNKYITKVVFPASVTTIEQSAFEGCSALEKVTFASGSRLASIGASAFKDDVSLTDVVLPEGLVSIGSQAFYKTSITTELTDENGVILSDFGFVIPDSVKEIGSQAFFGVTTMTILKLGSGLEKIGESAFVMNYVALSGESVYGQLYKIIWSLDIVETEDEEGRLSEEERMSGFQRLDKNMGSNSLGKFFATDNTFNLLIYFSQDALSYVQNKNISKWQSNSESKIDFKQTGELPTVTLMDGTQTLDVYQTEYITEGSVAVTPKDDYTFVEWRLGSEDGEAISYPYKVRTNSLTLYAYYQANKLSNADGFATVAEGSNLKITEVTSADKTFYVPDTVGNGSDVKTVTSINLNVENNTVEKIVFTKAANFRDMTENPFVKFKALRSVSMPNDAQNADFIIEDVILSATVGTGLNAQKRDYAFQAVYSRDGSKLIAFIGRAPSVYNEVTGATEIVRLTYKIKAGVSEICSGAFVNSAIATVYIPNTVSTIGDNVFAPELKSLQIQSNGLYIQSASYKMFASTGEGSFWETQAASTNNGSFIEVTGARYPNATEGESGDFYAIGNILLGYKAVYANVNKLTMPSKAGDINITVMAKNVFNVAEQPKVTIDNLTLPLQLQKINTAAFANCDVVEISENKNGTKYPYLTEIADTALKDLTYYTGTIILGRVYVKYEGTESAVVIPNNIVTILQGAFSNRSQYLQSVTFAEGSTLTKIGAEAFYGDTKLRSIVIPNSVTSIGASAFSGCTFLDTVTFDTVASRLDSIGDRAFMQCVALRDIKLPCSLTTIGKEAFAQCGNLASVTFTGYKLIDEMLVPDPTATSSLTTIGVSAFSSCSALATIAIPNGVTEIQSNTFLNCSSLETVEFDRNNSKLVKIGTQAFSGCSKLGSKLAIADEEGNVLSGQDLIYNDVLLTLHLPNSLREVEDEAFAACTGLWGVQFNSNISKLGSKIFTKCDSLVKIDFARATPPEIRSDTFANDTPQNSKYRLRIYVPTSEPQSESATYGPTMTAYINSWGTYTTDSGESESTVIGGEKIRFFLYEHGDLPTLHYTTGLSSEVQEVKAEIIVDPFYGSTAKGLWIYDSAKQSEKWFYDDGSNADGYAAASDINRKSTDDKKVHAYEYNRPSGISDQNNYFLDGTGYIVIIVDYDVVTIKPE